MVQDANTILGLSFAGFPTFGIFGILAFQTSKETHLFCNIVPLYPFKNMFQNIFCIWVPLPWKFAPNKNQFDFHF